MNTKLLKQRILDLAIHGRLVPQNPDDEPASQLLRRISEEKEKLIAQGKIKRPKKSDAVNHAQECPFEIPSSWEWVRLGEICEIFGRIGFRGYTKNDLVESDGAITLSPSNIVDGKMDYTKCTYISWEKYEESPEIQIQNGDILLVKTGSSYGKCSLVSNLPQKATINPQFVTLKYISINSKYLTYTLQGNYARKRYEDFVMGTAIPTFTQASLCSLKIPLPPLAEQTRIVSAIEKWFSLIDEIETNKESLQAAIKQTKSKVLDLAIKGKLVSQDINDEPASELLKRINKEKENLIAQGKIKRPKKSDAVNAIQEFPFEIPDSWEWVKLGDVCNQMLDGDWIESKDQSNDGIRLIQTGNIGFGKFKDKEGKYHYISESTFNSLGCTEIFPDDILISRLPEPVGRSCIIPHLNFRMITAVDCTIIRLFKTLLLPNYFVAYTQSNCYLALVEALCAGITRKRISRNNLSQVLIPLPPLSEQTRIVSKIEEVFALLDEIERELE